MSTKTFFQFIGRCFIVIGKVVLIDLLVVSIVAMGILMAGRLENLSYHEGPTPAGQSRNWGVSEGEYGCYRRGGDHIYPCSAYDFVVGQSLNYLFIVVMFFFSRSIDLAESSIWEYFYHIILNYCFIGALFAYFIIKEMRKWRKYTSPSG